MRRCNLVIAFVVTFVPNRPSRQSAAIDDRSLWGFCQRDAWVLFTENRNAAGADSLQQTLADLWQPGRLPVITLANKTEFEHNADYRKQVATDVAELLFGLTTGDYRDESRIYVPRT